MDELISICKHINQLAADRRGVQPIALDLSDFNSACNMMMIVSFPTQAQARAFAGEVEKELLEQGYPLKTKGNDKRTGWFLLAYNDLFIHIMEQSVRDHYSLEEVWRKAKKISL